MHQDVLFSLFLTTELHCATFTTDLQLISIAGQISTSSAVFSIKCPTFSASLSPKTLFSKDKKKKKKSQRVTQIAAKIGILGTSVCSVDCLQDDRERDVAPW